MKHFLAVLVFLGFSSFLHAESITSYEVNITIEQSGELLITENIDYDFEERRKHGIFRDIPVTIKNKGRIKDIGLSNYEVKLDGSPVEWKKSSIHSSSAGKTTRLKIGSADTYVSGKHRYTIAYRVKKGVLPAAKDANGGENKDAIRWNVIGTGWEVPISNITANIFLPESLNQSDIKLSTYTGIYGSKNTIATNRWISSKHLRVKVSTLKPKEGATVELAYPANILDQNGLDNLKVSPLDWIWDYWQWGALTAFLIYLKNLFRKQSISAKNSIAVQYEPPKGLTLLESGLILDKSADTEDFAAAILEMAQQGFIEITHKDKSQSPVLTPTNKSTEHLTHEQKYLLEEVFFKDKSSYKMKKASSSNSKIRKGFDHINDNLYGWVVEDGYMEANPKKDRNSFLKKTILYFLLPSIAMMLFTFYFKYGTESLIVLIFPLAFGGVGLSVLFGGQGMFSKVFGLMFTGAGMLPLLILSEMNPNNSSLLFSPLTMIIVIMGLMAFVYQKIGKYTQQGSETRSHLLGLKTFIKRVKQDEIKRRLESDPLFLDKLLPYALLFNEADHWFSLYDDLNVSNPSWYHGNMRHMRDFPSSVKAASTPPSSGGGYSGGGGSSGGGGGGGGGGSW